MKPKARPTAILLGALTLLSLSCSHKEESIVWLAPNWTPEGKIVFVEEKTIFTKHWSVGGGYSTVDDYIVTLYQIDKQGSNLTPIAHLTGYYPLISGPGVSTSATDSLVIVSTGAQMLLVERKTGKLLKDLGQGAYADFSPDGKRIVYQKYEGQEPKGIWIMDLESGEERCLVSNPDARYPSWSSEGGRIAYVLVIDPYSESQIKVCDTLNTYSKTIATTLRTWYLDWAPPDTNALILSRPTDWLIVHFTSGDSLLFDSLPAGGFWSPDGGYFVFGAGRICVYNRQGQEVGCYGP